MRGWHASIKNDSYLLKWKDVIGAYVCISCGSITDTKNLSLTALAKTVAADCHKKNKSRYDYAYFPKSVLLFITWMSWQHSVKWWAQYLLGLFDELITEV